MDKENSIAILTWLHNGNYGSILQAYALQKYLRNKGLRVVNIDFFPTVMEKIRNLIVSRNSFALFAEKFEAFQTNKKANPQKRDEKNKKFQEFLDTEFCLTQRYSKASQLPALKHQYDCYLCGSDQIWSPRLLNPAFFFSFLDDADKKVAYACSFGVSKVPRSKAKQIKSYLERFEQISVREYQGRAIVHTLLNREPEVVVDPTMLLSQTEWNLVASPRIVKEDYVFAYFLTYNREACESTERLAKQLHCKLVILPTVKEMYDLDGMLIEGVGPKDWLSLIKYAQAVVTDSFHGCVFSLIYQKDFHVFKRFSDASKNSQNSRIYTFLEMFGLQKCLVQNNDLNTGATMQDLQAAYKKMQIHAGTSKQWLENAVNVPAQQPV